MTCKRYEKKLALYAGGDLGANDARRVEAHLNACGVCRSFLEELEAARAPLSALRHAEPLEEDLAAIRQAVREGIVNAAPSRVGVRVRWGVLATACVVALVCAAFYALSVGPTAGSGKPQIARSVPQLADVPPVPIDSPVSDEQELYAAVPAFDPRPLDLPPLAETESNPLPRRFVPDPVLVKMYTNNPNIVVILLGDRERDTNHETTT